MSDYTLEEQIKSFSSQYIEQETKSSFLLLLLSALDRQKQQKQDFHYELHKDILNFQHAIKHYILNMEDILNDDTEIRMSALEDCMDLKNHLISIYESIYPYAFIWNTHFIRINDEVAIRKYKEENVSQKKVEWNVFYLDCREFLQTANDLLEQKTRIAELLKCIPIQMARSKYYDMIKQNLNFAFEGESEEMIQYSLDTFYSMILPEKKEKKKYFTELAEWIFSRKNVIPSELSDEELNEEYTDFSTVYEDLESIKELFECLFNDINSLICIFYMGYSFSELTEKEIRYSDLYYTVCEMLQNELSDIEKEAYFEKVYTSLEEAAEAAIDKANDIGKKELDYMKKIDDFSQFSEDTQKILLTEDFIRNCYYGQLQNELFRFKPNKQNNKQASQQWKEKAFDAFLNDIKEQFSTLSTTVRKSFMQMLFDVVPPSFSAEEALDMIQYAVESASTFEQKILIVDKAGIVFADHGFQYQTEETEHCGCGHDHHHEHHHHDHCDCGHDHHHNHHHNHHHH